MSSDLLTRADLTAIVASFDDYQGNRTDESILAADHYLGEEKARLLRPFRTLPDCERVARSALAHAEEVEQLRAQLRVNAAAFESYVQAVKEEMQRAPMSERAAVVAWLRVPCGAHYFADAIERGDHIRRGEVANG